MFLEKEVALSAEGTVFVPDIPSQSAKELTDAEKGTYAGELRLYYDGSPNILKPKSSTYGDTRDFDRNSKTFTTPHGGVDVYAPAWPYPHEVPVVAICAGKIERKFDDNSPDKNGHRIFLKPSDDPGERFIFAHLNRFEGPDRAVKPGEIIGYVGCSGNAGGANCLNPNNDFRIASSHVHLQRKKWEVNQNPLAALNWKLRYDTTSASAPLEPVPISLTDWDKRGELRDEVAKQPRPSTMLRIGDGAALGDEDVSRPWLDTPIDRAKRLCIANVEALATTERCYALATAKLAGSLPQAQRQSVRTVALAATAKIVTSLGATADDVGRHWQRLNDIANELFPDSAIPADAMPARIVEANTILTEVLFDGGRAFWQAICGPALRAVAAVKVASVAGSGSAPDGGLGINGSSLVFTCGRGVVGLHRSLLLETSAVGLPKPYSKWTVCAGFGSGSGNHAVLDQGIVSKVNDAGHKAVLAAVSDLWTAQNALAKQVYRVPPSDSRAQTWRAISQGLKAVATLRDAIGTAGTALAALPDDKRITWLQLLASTGNAALTFAVKKLKSTDPGVIKVPNEATVFHHEPAQP